MISQPDLRCVRALLDDPAEHDSEWGRSCHFCHSDHGRYDAPLEHYIDCPWLLACANFGVQVDWAAHVVFQPQIKPCEECGYYYVYRGDWRGRDMPEQCSDDLHDTHDTHVAATYNMTLEEYRATDPILLWTKSYRSGWVARGGISHIKPPDIFNEP